MLKIVETASEGNTAVPLDEVSARGLAGCWWRPWRWKSPSMWRDAARSAERTAGHWRCATAMPARGGDDGRRHGGGQGSPGRRPETSPSLHELDPAAVHASLGEGRGGPAGLVPAGSVDGRLQGGARRAARGEGLGPVCIQHCASSRTGWGGENGINRDTVFLWRRWLRSWRGFAATRRAFASRSWRRSVTPTSGSSARKVRAIGSIGLRGLATRG